MIATVRALFAHIMDYAGLFPPSRLPLPEALHSYLRYLQGPQRWLVNRFVCPTDRLGELEGLARAGDIGAELRVVALAGGGTSSAEFLALLEHGLHAIDNFRIRRGQRDAVDGLEVLLPAGLQPADLRLALVASAQLLKSAGMRSFLEIPAGPTWAEDIAEACELLGGTPNLGLKIRCSGTTAKAVPTEEQLADFMVRCRDAQLPWKATAGLHHPLRHFDPELRVRMHGFLNVYGAAVLGLAHALTPAQLVDILGDRDGRDFWFQDDRFGWKHWECTRTQIEEARARWLPGFGSCSIDEPYAGLLAQNMIAAESE